MLFARQVNWNAASTNLINSTMESIRKRIDGNITSGQSVDLVVANLRAQIDGGHATAQSLLDELAEVKRFL